MASEISSLASLYESVGRYQEAIFNDLKVQEVAPFTDIGFESMLSAANLSKMIGKTPEAEKIYQKLLHRFDNTLKEKISVEKESAVYQAKGVVYEEMGHNVEAVLAYQKAARLFPNWINPHSSLHKIYLKLGDHASAEQEFGIIQRLDMEVARSIKEATSIIKVK